MNQSKLSFRSALFQYKCIKWKMSINHIIYVVLVLRLNDLHIKVLTAKSKTVNRSRTLRLICNEPYAMYPASDYSCIFILRSININWISRTRKVNDFVNIFLDANEREVFSFFFSLLFYWCVKSLHFCPVLLAKIRAWWKEDCKILITRIQISSGFSIKIQKYLLYYITVTLWKTQDISHVSI